MADIKLFSGTAHPQLAQEVAEKMGLSLSKAEVIRFDDSEAKVTIQEDVTDQICVIIQPTCNPTDENVMELFLFCDALKRSEARKVIGVLPLFGYARQNAQHRPGECVSLHVVAQFLETIGFAEIYTFDLHEVASSGIFSIPFHNLSGNNVLAPAIKEYLGASLSKETIVIATPDQEGIERARNFGEVLFGNGEFSTATVSKKRNLDIKHKSEAVELFGDVKDKMVILVDDVCTSGGTLINAAQLCINKGASKVISAITHHDFSVGTADKLQNSIIEKFFTTNTIPLKESDRFDKLTEMSVSSIIARQVSIK